MPFASSVEGRYGFQGPGGANVKPLDSTQLNAIAAYLRGYMSEFRNPIFLGYNLDGDRYFIGDGGNGYFFYTSGSGVTGILAIQTLLSKLSGAEVTGSECQTVVQAFVNRIKIVTGF